MIYCIKNVVIVVLILLCVQVGVVSFFDIQVFNGEQQVCIMLSFIGELEYVYLQDGKCIVVLDIRQIGVIQGLLFQFSGNNLVKMICVGMLKDV